ncbi:hypothetical protein IQ269_17535 [Tychonema sp. LEGE 07199]|uniref:hypothetical protein n=1 Tax=unclassified Tychonema TaxID=2642144 RepID=UPI001880D23F|nr:MULTISPECIES: hypothetical protein [unclassified Tychonema]MBE9122552.1 hypothetical protein [Tychonema sp. LEGE 07199]MBE9131193.1 hypothetical protein [Tychonema sp. LEGE 07196]
MPIEIAIDVADRLRVIFGVILSRNCSQMFRFCFCRRKREEGRSPREEVRGKKSEGSSATSNVRDVTDVTDVSPSEEVRGKKESNAMV